jgi:hypothetical protein
MILNLRITMGRPSLSFPTEIAVSGLRLKSRNHSTQSLSYGRVALHFQFSDCPEPGRLAPLFVAKRVSSSREEAGLYFNEIRKEDWSASVSLAVCGYRVQRSNRGRLRSSQVAVSDELLIIRRRLVAAAASQLLH